MEDSSFNEEVNQLIRRVGGVTGGKAYYYDGRLSFTGTFSGKDDGG